MQNNYGNIKLDGAGASPLGPLGRKVVPSITTRALDKKGKREIENLLISRKLHESVAERLLKREDTKMRATAKRNLSQLATQNQGYKLMEDEEAQQKDMTAGLLPQIVPFGVQTPLIASKF